VSPALQHGIFYYTPLVTSSKDDMSPLLRRLFYSNTLWLPPHWALLLVRSVIETSKISSFSSLSNDHIIPNSLAHDPMFMKT
jgi:hypothetical protein